MIILKVAMQRPQFGLQPRHLYTAPGVRGHIPPVTISLIFASVRTLQEHTIIQAPGGRGEGRMDRSFLTHY